jgi:ribosomal protein S18 acetylase RimI-like enzyme
MLEIKKIKASDTYKIRLGVLRKGIPLPVKFNGDDDNDTFHLGAYKEGKLIAVSSFMKATNVNFKGSQYQLRGMATLPEYQGLGAGKLMMLKAFDIFKDLKVDCLWCNARIIALDFYKKLGLLTFGEMFELKHVGNHYVMYKYF